MDLQTVPPKHDNNQFIPPLVPDNPRYKVYSPIGKHTSINALWEVNSRQARSFCSGIYPLFEQHLSVHVEQRKHGSRPCFWVTKRCCGFRNHHIRNGFQASRCLMRYCTNLVLDLFQKSKTIEAFEKSLNDEQLKINNLDLDLDKKMDFIKAVTKKKDNSYTFILQVDVTKNETQDVAVILLDKGKDEKVTMQIVGDEELYGKDYVIEPKGNSPVTANPGYVGTAPVIVDVPATTTVVVQSAPIVQYVYSPAYVYAPPYYYGYHPPWFGFATVMAVGIYRSNHYHHHAGYYGGHYGGNNNVVINTGNRNNFNNYNNNKSRSATVSNNRANGKYGNGAANRTSNRPAASARATNASSNRAGNSASTRQSPSASTRQSPTVSSQSSRSGSRSSGGRSMSGGYSGGAARGGGGRRR